jgi:hypothetical protein
MTQYVRHLFTVVLLLLLSASLALGASVSVKPSGDGVFIIQGNSMDGVAGIDLTVDYDSSSLASPKVDQGTLVSGRAMFAANPNFASSTIKIGIISTTAFSGSGQIAVITFASHKGNGSIAVTTSMINSKGAPVSGGGKSAAADFQTSIASGSSTTATTSSAATTTDTTASSSTSTASTSSRSTYLGTVSMPSDVQAGNDTNPANTTDVPAQTTEPEATKPIVVPAEEEPVLKPQKPENASITSYKGTLENFHAYKGKKSPANLIALFNKNIAPTIRQEPAVALSDGKTPVKILTKLATTDDKLPNFALNGAKLISLNRDNASFTWIIEVLPQANIMQSSLVILTDSDRIEYPLTLAPLVEGVSPAEADFVVFLKDSGVATPKRDLNGDGKHDYLDDFIYTANYLMRRGATGKTKK